VGKPELGELRRVLGAATGAAVCVGVAVGAGILRVPGEVAHELPSATGTMGAWLLGGLVALLDTLVLAEMASSVPRAGGLVAYVGLSFGPATAFVAGWTILLVTWPASMASVAVAIGELIAEGAGSLASDREPTGVARAVASASIAALAAASLLGLRFSSRLEIALSAIKTALLAAVFVAAALALGAEIPGPVPSAAFPAGSALAGALAAAMVSVIFTYDGYADAVYLAGETRDPGRAMPRALFVALGTITGLYLLANAALLAGLGVERLASSRFPALDLVERALGANAATAVAAVALVVLVGALHTYFLTGPRIARLLAEERLALPILGVFDERGRSVAATLFLAAAAIGYALTNSFPELLELMVPLIWATSMLVAIGLLVQRRRAPERPRPFRVPAAPLVAGAHVAIGLAFLASIVGHRPVVLAIDAAAVASGFVVYAAIRRLRRNR